MTRIRVRILALLTALCGVGAADPARAEQVIGVEAAPTRAAGHQDVVVWSTRKSGRYFLVSYSNGTTSRLPVASRGVPFDVDLGPDRRGRTVAVYSRCRREPATGSRGQDVAWVSGRGCDVYRFDFARRRERRVREVSTRDGSEFLPTIWRGRVAFARNGRRRGAETISRLHVARLGGRGPAQRVPGGSQYPGGPPPDPPSPTSLDLRGRVLAFGWADAPGDGCPSERGLERRTQVWRVDVERGRRSLLEEACSLGKLLALGAVSQTASSVLYRALRFDPPSPWLLRRFGAGGLVSAVGTAAGEFEILSVAPFGGSLVVVRRAGSGAEVVVLEPPAFEPAEPQGRARLRSSARTGGR